MQKILNWTSFWRRPQCIRRPKNICEVLTPISDSNCDGTGSVQCNNTGIYDSIGAVWGGKAEACVLSPSSHYILLFFWGVFLKAFIRWLCEAPIIWMNNCGKGILCCVVISCLTIFCSRLCKSVATEVFWVSSKVFYSACSVFVIFQVLAVLARLPVVFDVTPCSSGYR
jgi:hypothetical protein